MVFKLFIMKNLKYIQKLAELYNEAPVSIALYQQLLTYDQPYFIYVPIQHFVLF